MALTDEGSSNGFFMPVAPAYGGGYGNGGFGFGNGDWAWIILLLLIGGNGWGFGGGFGGGMMWPMMMGGMNGFGLDYLYPWLNNSQNLNNGFRDQQINSQLGDLLLGQAGIQQSICQTGNSITGAVRDGFYAAETAANGRQMASMQTAFGIQTQIAQGSSDARLDSCQTRNVIQAEAAASRASGNADTQKILDKLCQLELDNEKIRSAAKDDTIAQLRSELLYARGQASQIAQNATIIDGVYDRLSRCPVGSTPVYGNTPIFTCQRPNPCGCPGNAGLVA